MIKHISSEEISDHTGIYDTIFINTPFDFEDLESLNFIENKSHEEAHKFIEVLNKSHDLLKVGGLIFIYGAPKYLPFYAKHLDTLKDLKSHYLFKYWIAIKYKEMFLNQPLPNSHLGMLMYLKSKNTKTPTPFKLNTKEYRIPYSNCIACGENLKDWGGKKHLMNPLGTAFSDVWTDLELNTKDLNKPDEIIERVYNLTKTNGENFLVINQDISQKIELSQATNISIKNASVDLNTFPYLNKVVKHDCIEFMREIKENYPDGVYDLAFADPPYNLEKNYLNYKDDKADEDYINWCNQWLDGMYDVLKPGGSLLVLNIPKWAIKHYHNLASKMHFRNWIVWDALSTPSGKLMPAHYSLLHFTKPLSNYKRISANIEIDDSRYCLRNRCIRDRKNIGDDKKQLLTDIWQDIHRIKHRKDRDYHPCQLPVKLMNRIIELYTNEEDLVFDPFGGAGTTAVAAKLYNRNFTITDIDDEYFKIAQENLNKVTENTDGVLVFDRLSIKRPRTNKISLKAIEKDYLKLSFENKTSLSLKDLLKKDKSLYTIIKTHYPKGIKHLKKIANRQLENYNLITQKDS